ncbi:Uncharacterised protein [Mycobacteroides abscessus subsp. abscessus]|nr:Uncharacterised protein [Mycobacteroides abscessus subsp. abscessus]
MKSIHPEPGTSKSAVNSDSLDTNPSSGGMPAIEAHPSAMTAKATGAGPMRRGMRVSSRVPAR